jgi:adenine-specific DNA-methyltransferase
MSHFIRTVLTEIFGEENFRNEIILPGRASKNLQQQFDEIARLNVRHDNLLWYTASSSTKIPPPWIEKHNKGNPEGHWHHFWSTADRPTMRYKLFGITPQTGQWVWKEELAKLAIKHYQRFLEEGGGRILSEYWRDTGCTLHFIRKSPDDGKPQYWRAPAENRLADTMWAGIPVYSNTTKYPTEKSEQLLAQIIDFVTSPGDLVMDVFAGSGTTATVAEKLGRRWIVCDFGKHAIYTMQKRMLRIGESKALGSAEGGIKKNQKYGKLPKPFCVVFTGAYDFSRIMKLRENKDAYVDFVLGLFQSSRDEKDLSGKYRLVNIFGEKDGDPVEVYPVWIDEKYLKGIILQSRGKLKGNYYIITPETCTLVGDTTMKNSAGNDVYFKMLKFPYKILEDVSRNFQIQQQPSSQENVNNLINSTGFYFNDDVEIEVERIKQGLKITRFETKILDNQGDRLKGLDGLAMLLVDVDYDEEIFDMDRTVFAKDISDDDKIRMTGLTESVAVIAIYKHGNESKLFIV